MNVWHYYYFIIIIIILRKKIKMIKKIIRKTNILMSTLIFFISSNFLCYIYSRSKSHCECISLPWEVPCYNTVLPTRKSLFKFTYYDFWLIFLLKINTVPCRFGWSNQTFEWNNNTVCMSCSSRQYANCQNQLFIITRMIIIFHYKIEHN